MSPVTGELGAFQWKVPVERLAYEGTEIAEVLPSDEEAEDEQAAPEIAAPVSAEPAKRTAEAEATAAPAPTTQEETKAKPETPISPPVRLPLPDDPGPDDDPAAPGSPDEWARRLAGTS